MSSEQKYEPGDVVVTFGDIKLEGFASAMQEALRGVDGVESVKVVPPQGQSGGMKYDQKKPPVGLLPFKSLQILESYFSERDDFSYDTIVANLVTYKLYPEDDYLLNVTAVEVLRLLNKDLTGREPGLGLPGAAILSVTEVLRLGALKYAPNSWQTVPNGLVRYVDAALRHLFAYHSGEINDPEFGTSHLAHAACCLLFAIHLTAEPQ